MQLRKSLYEHYKQPQSNHTVVLGLLLVAIFLCLLIVNHLEKRQALDRAITHLEMKQARLENEYHRLQEQKRALQDRAFHTMVELRAAEQARLLVSRPGQQRRTKAKPSIY